MNTEGSAAKTRSISDSLVAIRRGNSNNNHLTNFVNVIDASLTFGEPGSVIVAACSQQRLAEVTLAQLSQINSDRQTPLETTDGAKVYIKINVPPECTGAKRELLDRFRTGLGNARLHHRTKPRFPLDHCLATYPRTDKGEVVQLLRFRGPQFVVLKDSSTFNRPYSQTKAILNDIVDLAAESRIKHVYFVDVHAGLKLAADAHFSRSTRIHLLAPYDCRSDTQKSAFTGVLADFDKEIPWEKDQNLVSQMVFIANAIGGDVDRLRLWVLRALEHAVIRKAAVGVCWQDFLETLPSKKDTELALKEMTCISAINGGLPASDPDEDAHRLRHQKPGTRDETRDPVLTHQQLKAAS